VNFRKVDEGRYVFTDADNGIEFHVDRLRRERGGELIGELSVACGILGAKVIDGVLSAGSFNYSSVPARAQRAKLLGERARTNGKLDWLERLEEVCQRVTLEDRSGDPGVVLANVPRPSAEEADDHDVLGIKVPQRHGTIVFGDGGTGKSELAMMIAIELERRGIHCGFFDWELDATDQRPRLERIGGVPLGHRRWPLSPASWITPTSIPSTASCVGRRPSSRRSRAQTGSPAWLWLNGGHRDPDKLSAFVRTTCPYTRYPDGQHNTL
jgi:hypothetical protein